jgi:hypothetical protein
VLTPPLLSAQSNVTNVAFVITGALVGERVRAHLFSLHLLVCLATAQQPRRQRETPTPRALRGCKRDPAAVRGCARLYAC